jgi:hypothetical protein
MIQLRFVPIEKWPGARTRNRAGSPFRANYLNTLDLLESELRHLRARDIVLQASIGWQDIRNDGWPKSNARFTDPGVILTFESANGPLSFPCDRYTDWQANVRAIGLSLEALRAVDRYGATRRAEQYQGWRQIAAPGAAAHFGSVDAAAEFLAVHAQSGSSVEILRDSDARKRAYRKAAARYHTDAPTGNVEMFHLVQEAVAVLEAMDNTARAGG